MGSFFLVTKDAGTTRWGIEEASKKYLETNDSADLILSLEVYVQHVTEHLWKEKT